MKEVVIDDSFDDNAPAKGPARWRIVRKASSVMNNLRRHAPPFACLFPVRNQQVAGSIPAGGSIESNTYSDLICPGFDTVCQNQRGKSACGNTLGARKRLKTGDRRTLAVGDPLTDCQRVWSQVGFSSQAYQSLN